AQEVEAAGGEPAGREGGDERGGPGDRHDGEAGLDGLGDEALAGVRDGGAAGVGDEGAALSGGDAVDDGGGALAFGERGQAHLRLVDAVRGEQPARVAGVFAGDEVDRAQRLDGPGREIAEVADGGRDEEEPAGGHAVTSNLETGVEGV